MAVTTSKTLDNLGANLPLSLEPILVKIEGVHYVGPILPDPVAELLTGWRPTRGSGNGGGGSSGGRIRSSSGTVFKICFGAPGGTVREGAGAVRCAPDRPVPLGWGELADTTGGDGTP